ncbi:MAG TPA: ECF-type sigma factor [Urbifossiella sp.]|jgi:RNA polymerase sigma-70 factor (ECF subfamily)|nr:ECF-type sigma factor [Urbifossiella sp.]
MSTDHPFAGLMADLRLGDPEAAREVFDRFARRLAGLAATRLPAAARSKLDPEDVAQSVLRTFFRRHAAGEFAPDHWDALWSLLAVLAVRKCGHRVGQLFAARRDARRDAAPPDPSASGTGVGWDPPDRAPSPSEAVAFADTLAAVLAGLKDRERAVVELRLQGYEVAEVAAKAGCSERTAHRLLAAVRVRLEQLAAD